MKTAKKKKKQNGISALLGLLMIIFIGIVAYLGGTEVKKELSIRDMEQDLTQYEESDEGFDWDALRRINPDVVGWIRFEEPSRINYPIVRGKSNQTYLKKDWRGNYQEAGAIFMNKHNNKKFTDANTVLYGHRMIAGSMFGSLKKYQEQTYLDANPYFYIYTPDGKKRTYEIFAYAPVIDGSETYQFQFISEKERKAHYNEVIKKAITKRKVKLNAFSTTMVLSTCASSGYYNRMIVMAKLIRIEVDYKNKEELSKLTIEE